MSQDGSETPDPLPKTLPGVVCAQRVRCGKPACRCARGPGHLAYYRFWREGGRLRKAHVRRADLESVRAAGAAAGGLAAAHPLGADHAGQRLG
ncbi:MAG TPA: DUF6788 family protein [Fimbriiglobus sp.]|nr:DUF6788 family protein [Fimbriiglobus sp.]